MKFKKSHIKQIIKEEIQNLIAEAENPQDPYFEERVSIDNTEELKGYADQLGMLTSGELKCDLNDSSADIVQGFSEIRKWIVNAINSSQETGMVDRPEDFEYFMAVLDKSKPHLTMVCQATDINSQKVIQAAEEIHEWFVRTFMGGTTMANNPAYSSMMNENKDLIVETEDLALNALASLKMMFLTPGEVNKDAALEQIAIVEKHVKSIGKEEEDIKSRVAKDIGAIRPGTGPIKFRPSRSVTIAEGDENNE